jgi:hypothetical protein
VGEIDVVRIDFPIHCPRGDMSRSVHETGSFRPLTVAAAMPL